MDRIVVRSDTGLRTAINVRTHTIFTDEPLESGGEDTAPTPMEMLVGTVGACMVITSRLYAQRKGWPLEDVRVELDFERLRKEDYPAYTGEAGFVNEIRYKLVFGGSLLTVEQKERLQEVARKCPVHRTLEYPTFFVEGLRVQPVEEP